MKVETVLFAKVFFFFFEKISKWILFAYTEQNKPEKKGSYCMISLTQNSRTGRTIMLIETRPVVKDGGGID